MKLFVKTHPYLWFQCSIMNDIDRRSIKRRKKKEWDNRLPAFLNGWIRNTEEWRWILSIKQILFSTTGDEDDIMWLCISRKEVTKNKPVFSRGWRLYQLSYRAFFSYYHHYLEAHFIAFMLHSSWNVLGKEVGLEKLSREIETSDYQFSS